MLRKLLITVSEDVGFLHGVRFVSHFFSPGPDIQMDLILMPPAPVSESPHDPIPLETAIRMAEKLFADAGFAVAPLVSMSTPFQCQSLEDLAYVADHGRYDAVVLGRRGAARLEEYLAVRYNETVFDANLDYPFWVCREPDICRKNVLLCVDGSKQGLCAADHVGFMCRNETRHSICVAYFTDSAQRDRRDEELIIENALRMLRVNDIPDERITTKIFTDQDHFHGVLREADQGHYAVVAVGRAGAGRGMMNQRQFGTVTLRLARSLTKASLWVCGYPCKL